jgi:hypothetical protein
MGERLSARDAEHPVPLAAQRLQRGLELRDRVPRPAPGHHRVTFIVNFLPVTAADQGSVPGAIRGRGLPGAARRPVTAYDPPPPGGNGVTAKRSARHWAP